jgi:hypothetical protein
MNAENKTSMNFYPQTIQKSKEEKTIDKPPASLAEQTLYDEAVLKMKSSGEFHYLRIEGKVVPEYNFEDNLCYSCLY